MYLTWLRRFLDWNINVDLSAWRDGVYSCLPFKLNSVTARSVVISSMSESAPASGSALQKDDDDDDVPSIPAALSVVPTLRIDDAFSTGNEDDDEDLSGSSFDLASIVRLSRTEEERFESGDASRSPSPRQGDESAEAADLEVPSSITPTSVRNGRAVPPPLRLVTPTMSSSTLPELDDHGSALNTQFEDVSLSPPSSPRTLATTSFSPEHVPVPLSPHTIASPSSSTTPGLNGSSRSISSQDPRIIRTMSPRPNYLSPSSAVPVPQHLDPVPRRPPTPALNEPSSPTTNSRTSSYSSNGPPSPKTARQNPRHSRSYAASSSSALEKVLSKTRPSHLPPKPKEEDVKHQKAWDVMMRRSRQAEEARVEQQKVRAREREMAITDKLVIWERDILPDWRRVLRPGNENLRRLWWEGIPSKLRGQLWTSVIGNGLALSKGTKFGGHLRSQCV